VLILQVPEACPERLPPLPSCALPYRRGDCVINIIMLFWMENDTWYEIRFEHGLGWYRVTRCRGVACPSARWIPFDDTWWAWWNSGYWILRSDGWNMLRPWPYGRRHRGNIDMILNMVRQCATCVRLDASLARTFREPGPAASQESFLHVLSEQYYHPSFDRLTTDDRFGGGVRVLSSFRPAAAERLPGSWEWFERAVPTTRRWTCNFSGFDFYGLPGFLWTLAIDLVREHVPPDHPLARLPSGGIRREPWMVLRIFFGMAHRVDLIGSHGAAQVAEEWGAPTFPDHPCLADPSRIAGLGALRDALEMLMRYILLVRTSEDFPDPTQAPRQATAEWYKDMMGLAVEQHEHRRQQQMRQLRWNRHLLHALAPNINVVWAKIAAFCVPRKMTGLLVGSAQYHPEDVFGDED